MLITMTLPAALAALALAISVGYYCGRRAGSTRSKWGKRTSRVALGKRAVDLAVLIAVRRIHRRFATKPELVGLRIPAPLNRLRGSGIRTRFDRAVGW